MNTNCNSTTTTRITLLAIACALHLGAMPAGAVSESEVSFTVHDPGEATVYGTRFEPENPKRATGTAVLLLHGAISDRHSWTGPIEGVPSVAHKLANAGHTVFAIDRLGYGASQYNPFPGAGWTITYDTQVKNVHDIVTQIRAGTYSLMQGSGEAASATPAIKRVILVGISYGAVLVEVYATRYQDVDGIVPMGFSTQGVGTVLLTIFGKYVIPQFVAGQDYVYFFPPGGIFPECPWLLFYEPGIDPAIAAAACADGFFGTSPSGEFNGGVDSAEIRANIGNVTSPVLLVFGQYDSAFPTADYVALAGTDTDVVTPEIAMWQNGCDCDVDVYIAKNTGHAIFWHDQANRLEWIEGL